MEATPSLNQSPENVYQSLMSHDEQPVGVAYRRKLVSDLGQQSVDSSTGGPSQEQASI